MRLTGVVPTPPGRRAAVTIWTVSRPLSDMTRPRGTRLAAPTAGLLAVAVALAIAELAGGILPGGQSPLAVVADRIFALMLSAVMGLAIDLLGTANRPVLLLGMLGVSAAAGVSIGLWAARWRWAAPLGLIPFVLLGAAAGIADPLLPPAAAVAAPLVGALAGLVILWRFPGIAAAGRGDPSEPGDEVALPDPTAPPTPSRRDVPRHRASLAAGPVAVAGVAWAGERGIDRVEVSVDDRAWEQAELADELASSTWRQWRLRWDAEPGEHALRVRATDHTGQTQTDRVSPPDPDGATGHHTISISIA
jgi:hypothetical protein